MATITTAELAAAMRLGDGEDPPEPILGIIERLKNTAIALIDSRCADIPDDSRNEGIIRLASYIYDSPPAPSGTGQMSAWHYSAGAGAPGALAGATNGDRCGGGI